MIGKYISYNSSKVIISLEKHIETNKNNCLYVNRIGSSDVIRIVR